MIASAQARPRHDHGRCVADALERAEAVCGERGVRLTELRRHVLELVWQGHAPAGAYEVLEGLRAHGRRADPPTVYRALDFLMEQGLVHRVESRNAYAGCANPQEPHHAQYLLCEKCGDAIEVEIGGLARRVEKQAAEIGFDVAGQTMEAHGICGNCRAAEHAAAP